MNFLFNLFSTCLLICFTLCANGQCADPKIEDFAQLVAKKVVNDCTGTPNKLKIIVTKCNYDKNLVDSKKGWKIWVTISWSGKYTTLDYGIKLYIEKVDQGSIGVYYLEYSSSLVHRCIDLSNTKPLKIKDSAVEYFPFKEFQYSELE